MTRSMRILELTCQHFHRKNHWEIHQKLVHQDIWEIHLKLVLNNNWRLFSMIIIICMELKVINVFTNILTHSQEPRKKMYINHSMELFLLMRFLLVIMINPNKFMIIEQLKTISTGNHLMNQSKLFQMKQ